MKKNIKILTQLKSKYYYENLLLPPLNPYYVTGFTDAEGSFSISIDNNHYFQFVFSIKLATVDSFIIFCINSFFNNTGSISLNINDNYISLRFGSRKVILDNIIPHFDQFPLYTKKKGDYLLFREALFIAESNHFSREDKLNQIIPIILALNTTISNRKTVVVNSFPSFLPAKRPLLTSLPLFNPWWVTGFTDGDGSFIGRKRETPNGTIIRTSFELSQHIIDLQLIKSFTLFFSCGNLRVHKTISKFTVENQSDLIKNIIPHFEKYPPQAIKKESYKIWAELIHALIIERGKPLPKRNNDFLVKLVNNLQTQNRNKISSLIPVIPF